MFCTLVHIFIETVYPLIWLGSGVDAQQEKIDWQIGSKIDEKTSFKNIESVEVANHDN